MPCDVLRVYCCPERGLMLRYVSHHFKSERRQPSNEPRSEHSTKSAAGKACDHCSGNAGTNGPERRAQNPNCDLCNCSPALTEELSDRLEDRFPETTEEAIAGRISEVERTVSDIRIAVP